MEDMRVHRQYADPDLGRVVHEVDFRPEGWGERAVADLRLLAQCARAAEVAEDLLHSRLLGLQPDRDDPDSVRATLGDPDDEIELVLTFRSGDGSSVVVFDQAHSAKETR